MSKQRGGGTLSGWVLGVGYRGSKQARVPCCRVWPNGEFGLGYAPRLEEALETERNLAGGVSLGAMRAECDRIAATGAEPLDLTSPSNSHMPVRGMKGMTGYGQKMVRNGAFILQRDAGMRNLTFLTLTLPPMGETEALRVVGHWGEIVRQLIQWVARRLKRSGLRSSVVLVTELQTARLERHDAACLHIHAVFQGKKRGKTWAIPVGEMRTFWVSLLSRIAGEEVFSANCVDMKQVRKNAANYLSKYMSKGCGDIEKLSQIVGVERVPSTWWNMTSEARRMVKRECLTGSGVAWVVDELVRSHIRDSGGWGLKFVKAIEIPVTEIQTVVIGYWGVMDAGTVGDLTDMVKSA